MPAQASATRTQQFVVEVSDPYSEILREDTIRCESVEGLAAALDEQLGWGKGVCEELAERVAAGESFAEEVDGLDVSARLVGGRS